MSLQYYTHLIDKKERVTSFNDTVFWFGEEQQFINLRSKESDVQLICSV